MITSIEKEIIRIDKQIDDREADKFFSDSWEQHAKIGTKIDDLNAQKKELLDLSSSLNERLLINIEEQVSSYNKTIASLKLKLSTIDDSKEKVATCRTIVCHKIIRNCLEQEKTTLLAKSAHDKSIP